MITTSTVFILGAGASKPYGYPTGRKLREYICNTMPSDVETYLYRGKNSLKNNETDSTIKRAEKLAEIFSLSSTSSIDLFLSRNTSFEAIGKLAIIVSMFEAEAKSGFNEASKKPEQDWYFYLYNRMTGALTSPDDLDRYKRNKVTFITFNYDRSLEHYFNESFYHSFYDSFSNRPPYITDIFPFEIIHVYGEFAPLTWQVERGGYKYGLNRAENDNKVLAEGLTDNIRVIYDRTDDDITDNAKKIISKAKRVFFLGFGFAEENLKVLGLPGNLSFGQEIYGTAFGMTDKEIGELKDLIYNGMGGNRSTIYEEIRQAKENIKIEKKDCLNLIREYL